MKKIILILFVIFNFAFFAKAQQLPLYSQYMLNGFLLNPAIAGSVDFSPICLTARQQWVGIDDAPSTQAISGYTQMKRNMGVGGYIYNDHFGPVNRTGVQGTYAYHLDMNNQGMKLGLGVSVSAFQYAINESSFQLESDAVDPAISYSQESTFVPDANFGAYLYDEKWNVGVAVAQLFQFDLKLSNNSDARVKMARHYFINGGYLFDITSDIKLEPSVMIKATETSPMQMDLNVKAYYVRKFWLGFSYRTDNSIIAMLGLKIDKYYVGYAFDYATSNLNNYTSGSHEIMIGINLGEDENKGSSLL